MAPAGEGLGRRLELAQLGAEGGEAGAIRRSPAFGRLDVEDVLLGLGDPLRAGLDGGKRPGLRLAPCLLEPEAERLAGEEAPSLGGAKLVCPEEDGATVAHGGYLGCKPIVYELI